MRVVGGAGDAGGPGSQPRAAGRARPGRWLWVWHGPPEGPLSWTGSRHYGDPELPRLLDLHRPDVVLCGHIHQAPFVPRRRVGRAARCDVAVQRWPPARPGPDEHLHRSHGQPRLVVVVRRHRRGLPGRRRAPPCPTISSRASGPTRLDLDRRARGQPAEDRIDHRQVALGVGELRTHVVEVGGSRWSRPASCRASSSASDGCDSKKARGRRSAARSSARRRRHRPSGGRRAGADLADERAGDGNVGEPTAIDLYPEGTRHQHCHGRVVRLALAEQRLSWLEVTFRQAVGERQYGRSSVHCAHSMSTSGGQRKRWRCPAPRPRRHGEAGDRPASCAVGRRRLGSGRR